ncbi:DUF3027 domain-containing protein [Arthrobacter sp.]|uniref:DUF3027 domain-containing protein n=1 Tax=Arthrobacter sp. TaxID=1667 RepID=UPI002812006C|nr:DUF3027 domain-containing protein [Arthrobacter sp.]
MTESPASTESGEAQPAEAPGAVASAVPAAKRRPARKPSKPDAVLAAAVDAARNGVLEIADGTPVGEHLGVVPEAERLVTHRFAANVPGYVGWHWFATLARVPRGKDVTVCEVGLLPSADALLAPDWVPWSERVRPEDTAEETAEETAAGDSAEAAEVDPVMEADVDPEEDTADSAHAEPEPAADEPADSEPVERGSAGTGSPDPDADDPSTPGGESPVA